MSKVKMTSGVAFVETIVAAYEDPLDMFPGEECIKSQLTWRKSTEIESCMF